MDSEHRHELEENALARWLSDRLDVIQDNMLTIVVVLVVILVTPVVLSWRNSSAKAEQASQWRDFTVAVEGARPNLALLQEAASSHPGTPVEEWSQITWADGKLWEATRQFLRDRAKADEALAEAESAYQGLQTAKETEVAQRATFGLARASELRGDLEKAIEQYGRVTGAFAEIATLRAEELGSETVKADYAWLTSTNITAASTTLDPAARPGLEPDEIALPEDDSTTPEEAEAAMDDILKGLESADEAAAEEGEAAAEE